MPMTKSRRLSAGTPAPPKRFRPILSDLVDDARVESHIEAGCREIDEHVARLAGLAFSYVWFMRLELDAMLEAAFERIAHLEADIRKMKAAPRPTYRGAWKEGQETKPGEFVTHQGSVWHCNKKTLSRPGDDPAAFTLAVKRGQDGKDAIR